MVGFVERPTSGARLVGEAVGRQHSHFLSRVSASSSLPGPRVGQGTSVGPIFTGTSYSDEQSQC